MEPIIRQFARCTRTGCTSTGCTSTGRSVPAALLWILLAALVSLPARAGDFDFARRVYEGGGGLYGWPRWQADWPEAEAHFTEGLERLTVLDVATDDVLVRMDGEDIFDYPWIYVVEVGYMSLSPTEVLQLREYLLRGGFMMVDDFHGRDEWQQFESVMRQVFPERRIVDLTNDNEAFHVLYDVSEREQIPGIRALMSNRTWEKDGRYPHWRGIMDDQDRVIVAINFNQDIGDAWEHADDARYPARLTTQAYRLGVNYVVYALTH